MPPGNPEEPQAEFTRLIEPHFDRLFRFAYRLTGSRCEAEDLLQDVLTGLYEQRKALDAIDDLKPWLSRVLYNRFVDLSRAAKRRPLKLLGDAQVDPMEPEPGANDPVTLTAAAEYAERLNRALARLSDKHRLLVLMHDAEGYSLREIAAFTGIPTGTLKSRLSRARARLRELLGSLEPPERAGPGRAVEKKMEPFSGERRVDR